MNPFDFIKAINSKKTDNEDIQFMIDHDKESIRVEPKYLPYIINKAFSNEYDSVMLANEMNTHWRLDNQLQFDFYYHGLSRRNRYGKWFKADKTVHEDLEAVKEFYGYSNQKANEVLSIIDTDGIAKIKQQLRKGGRYG